MRLGIYAFWKIHWNGSQLRAPGYVGKYVRAFLRQADQVRLFAPLTPVPTPDQSELIADPRLQVVPLPCGGSHVSAWLRMKRLARVLDQHAAGLDAFYALAFSPCPWLLAPLCERRGLGLVYHIIGNPIEGILQRSDWAWPARWGRRLLFWPEEQLVFRAARRHTLLINGADNTRYFAPRHPAPETVISSTVDRAQFRQRDDTCQQGPVRVLYVGFIRPPKRVEVLIAAVGQLVRAGRDVQLRIVGAAHPAGFLRTIQDRIQAEGIADRVQLPGLVTHEELFQREYPAADIFAFPSISEGSPRVLLEAASQSLPIVTTNVGSVGELFSDRVSAQIVPREDPGALAQAIARFVDDPDLRRRCIRNAAAVAGGYTCEGFIAHIVQRLHEASRAAQAA